MNYWTLEIADADGTNAVEKRLTDWNVTGATLNFKGLAEDTLTLRFAERDFTGSTFFEALKRARLYLRPAQEGAPGTPAMNGGTKYFEGVLMNFQPSNEPGNKSSTLPILGPWYWFKNGYSQQWKDNTKVIPTLIGTTSHVFLFLNPDFGKAGVTNQLIDCATQLQNIVQYYKDRGCPIDLDLSVSWEPAGMLHPIMPQRDISGETAIRACLEKAPQVTCRWDYSASPPRIRFFDPAKEGPSRPPITIGPSGYNLAGVHLTRRSDLYVPAVQINYELADTINGQAMMRAMKPEFNTVDIWPADAWDGTKQQMKDSYWIEGGMVQTVDLQGAQVQVVKGELVCRLADVLNPLWWQLNKPALTAVDMKSWSFAPTEPELAVTVTDLDAPLPVVLPVTTLLINWPYQIVDGGFAPWMKLSHNVPGIARRVLVSMRYTFTKLDGTTGSDIADVEFTATNLPTGTYHATQSIATAEQIPTGLARVVQESLGVEKWEGSISLLARQAPLDFRIGDVVNLSGGLGDWLAMNAQVQEVSFDLFTGNMGLKVGFAPYLNIQQREDLLRLLKIRRVWLNPACQGDPSKVGSGGQVVMPSRSTYAVLPPGVAPNYAAVTCQDDNTNPTRSVRLVSNDEKLNAPCVPALMNGQPIFALETDSANNALAGALKLFDNGTLMVSAPANKTFGQFITWRLVTVIYKDTTQDPPVCTEKQMVVLGSALF